MCTPSSPGADKKSHSEFLAWRGRARVMGGGESAEEKLEVGGASAALSLTLQINQDGEPGCVSSGLLALSAPTIGRARGNVVLATY